MRRWELDAALVPATYVRAIGECGGAPLLVPPGAATEETLDAVDGLVFSGGSDLDPELYGEEAHAETMGVVRERDDFELALMRAALARDLPVLAICRGSQVLNVALGGGIEQHVPDRVGERRTQGDAGRVRRARRRRASPARASASILGDHARREVAPPPGLRRAGRRPARSRAMRPTGRWKHSRIRRAVLRSASSGIRKQARTWRSSQRWSQKRPPTEPRSSSPVSSGQAATRPVLGQTRVTRAEQSLHRRCATAFLRAPWLCGTTSRDRSDRHLPRDVARELSAGDLRR